ncbi:MAG: thiolase family protein [Lentilitoribacter sp.]
MTSYSDYNLDAERRPVIIAAKRTPIGRANGLLKDISAEDLLSPLLIDVTQASNFVASDIDDVIIGNAAGGGGNVARLAALKAGLDIHVPGLTIDRQCGGGLEAINLACRMVMSGAGQLYLAGGVESVSTAPKRAKKKSSSADDLEFYDRARFSPDSVGDPDMGVAAENVAKKYEISRKRQDEFALQSHQRAINAQNLGKFDDEIVPIRLGDISHHKDECPRADTSLDKLAALPAKFSDGGSVTAGNSCPLNDGAALVVVTSLAKAQQLGAGRVIEFIDGCARGVDPNYLGIGPVASTNHLFARQSDISADNFQFVEFNEAFASQVLASLEGLSIASDRINKDGGALALGHPFGASGAILVVRLFSQMLGDENFQNDAVSLATLGTAGGMGVSTFFRSKKVS